MTDAVVKQLGRGAVGNSAQTETGSTSVLRTYNLIDIFPTEVSAIDLSYETTDTVEQFDVTFQMQYFTVGTTATNADRAVQSPVGLTVPNLQ